MRKEFEFFLYNEMSSNKDIVLITADLGYGLWDRIKKDYPDRFINVMSSEQLMLGIACGLSMEGKLPVCYSITPFLIYRPFEWIRNYLDHEKINVKLVGGGRDRDYQGRGRGGGGGRGGGKDGQTYQGTGGNRRNQHDENSW